MSDFDTNPFAEAASDNPFNVRVAFVHVARWRVGPVGGSQPRPGSLLGGCGGGTCTGSVKRHSVLSERLAMLKPISELCLEAMGGVTLEGSYRKLNSDVCQSFWSHVSAVNSQAEQGHILWLYVFMNHLIMFSWRNMEIVRGEASCCPSSTDAASLTFRARWVAFTSTTTSVTFTAFCPTTCFGLTPPADTPQCSLILIETKRWPFKWWKVIKIKPLVEICPDSWDLQMNPDLSGLAPALSICCPYVCTLSWILRVEPWRETCSCQPVPRAV